MKTRQLGVIVTKWALPCYVKMRHGQLLLNSRYVSVRKYTVNRISEKSATDSKERFQTVNLDPLIQGWGDYGIPSFLPFFLMLLVHTLHEVVC